MEEKGDQRHSSTQEIHTYTQHNLYLCFRVCMCVCACVCEGEERCTHLFKDWTTDLSTKLVDVDMI